MLACWWCGLKQGEARRSGGRAATLDGFLLLHRLANISKRNSTATSTLAFVHSFCKLLSLSSRRTTLFVAGFGHDLRARDLAYEFERFGRLVRCDIPAPKSSTAKVGYAFVEFEDERDAEDAYHDMHGRRVDGYQLTVQWAKNAPSTNWRYERRGGDGDRGSRDGGRGGGDSREYRGGGRERDYDSGSRRRSPSPPRRSNRSPSPRRGGSPGRDASPLPSANKEDREVDGADRRRDEASPEPNGGRRDDRSPSPRP